MFVRQLAKQAVGGVILPAEALPSEPASRNASEPKTASLRKREGRLALQRAAKPEAGDEATITSNHRVFRGGRGRRAGRDQSGTWETHPVGGNGVNGVREDITGFRIGWESDGLIVAGKRVTTVERRDPTEGMSL